MIRYYRRKEHMNLKSTKSYTERNTLWQPSFEYTLTETSMFKMFATICLSVQKQSPRGVPRKKCFEDMQQIYRRTPMPIYDFNKVACNFIEITLPHGCSPVKLLYIFRTSSLNTSGGCFCRFTFKYYQSPLKTVKSSNMYT